MKRPLLEPAERWQTFLEKCRTSNWISPVELRMFEDGEYRGRAVPRYLAEWAEAAIEAGEAYEQKVRKQKPTLARHLDKLSDWLRDPAPKPGDFPGIQVSEDVIGPVVEKPEGDFFPPPYQLREPLPWPDLPQKSAIADAEASSEVFTFSETFLPEADWRPMVAMIQDHPFAELDDAALIELLANDLTLSLSEKDNILQSIPNLTQKQADDLVENLKKEHQALRVRLHTRKKHELLLISLKPAEWRQLVFYRNRPWKDKQNIRKAFFEYETFLNPFLDMRFSEASEKLTALLNDHPENLFLLEWRDRLALAMSGVLPQETHLEDQELATALDMSRLLYQELPPESLYEQLCEKPPPEHHAYWHLYLLSSFHLHFSDDPKHADKALQLAIEALDQVDLEQGFIFASLMNHLMTCMLYTDYQDELAPLLTSLFGNAWPKRFVYLKPYFFSWQSRDNDIRTFGRRSGIYTALKGFLSGNPDLSDKGTQQFLEQLDEILIAAKAIGFANDSAHEALLKIHQALAQNDMVTLCEVLSDVTTIQTEGEVWLELATFEYQIHFFANQAEDYLERLGNQSVKTPSANHAYLYLNALLKDGPQQRLRTKQLSEHWVRRFFFLPQFHALKFRVEHELFTVVGFGLKARESYQRSLALGPHRNSFRHTAEFKRWNEDPLRQILFGFLTGYTGFGDFGQVISGAARGGWFNLAIGFFCKMVAKGFDRSGLTNQLGVGIVTNNVSVPLIFNDANQISHVLNEVLLGNLSASLKSFTFIYAELNRLIIYKTGLGLWNEPAKAYNTYPAFLGAAVALNHEDIYLVAYHNALEHEAPQLKDSHRERAEIILNRLLQSQTPLSSLTPIYLTYLAYALVRDCREWAQEQTAFDIDLVAFDFLSEVARRQPQWDENQLGALEAEQLFSEMCLDDSFILLWHPELSTLERHQKKMVRLQRLAQQEPARFQALQERTSAAWVQRDFRRSLNSGRITHDPRQTLRLCATSVANELDQAKTTISRYEISKQELLRQIEAEMMSLSKSRFRGSGATKAHARLMDEELAQLAKQHQAEMRQHEEALFQKVLAAHALDRSDMFQSFRARIRHGWLTAGLKGSLARHDLYADESDSVIPSALQSYLHDMPSSFTTEVEERLGKLRDVFNETITQLDQSWLWFVDEDHPEAWLDFSLQHFDLADFFRQYPLSQTPHRVLISAICREVDQRAEVCFAHIHEQLKTRVAKPLLYQLKALGDTLFAAQNHYQEAKRLDHWGHLRGLITQARKDLQQRLSQYQSWFQFEETGTRDFTLPEIVDLAWETCLDLERRLFKDKAADRPIVNLKSLDQLWIPGANFLSLLEIFKILYQNAIHHGIKPVQMHVDFTGGDITQQKMVIQVSSTGCPPELDVDALNRMLHDPNQRSQRLIAKQGSGLATVAELLEYRLYEGKGSIQVHKQAPNRFVVTLKLQFQRRGQQSAPKPQDGFVKAANAFKHLKGKTGRILVIEDQDDKFDALVSFTNKLMPNCGIVRAADVETAVRMVYRYGSQFDLALLDMTLPYDDTPVSATMLMGGLWVLKALAYHQIPLPTILVTQYSHWADEAKMNSAKYLTDLEQMCRRDYPNNFRAAIRFSHTEMSWQAILETTLKQITAFQVESREANTFQALTLKLQQDPGDVPALEQLGHYWLNQQRFQDARDTFEKLLQLEPQHGGAHRGMALALGGLGLFGQAEQHVAACQEGSSQENAQLHQALLKGQLQSLKERQNQLHQNQMMVALGRISRFVAHEFRTPLQAISNAVDYSKSYLKPNDEILDAFADIEASVQQMTGLVDHIKKLAQGNRAAVEPCSLAKLLEQVLALHVKALEKDNIALTIEVDQDLPSFQLNPVLFEQVLLNLIWNARDALVASPQATKDISIACHEYVQADKRWLRVRVADNGPGIRPEIRDQIFEPFFTTKDVGSGMGLGLSFVYETAVDMGGTVRLDPEASKGAVFILDIPERPAAKEYES